MQNDLISRSALLKEFEKRQEQQTNKYCDCFLNDAQELSTEWWCVEDAVIAAPAIDAVPVVRCGECWRRQTVNCPMFLRGGDYACRDGFCHMGAKMDGGVEC